MVIENGAVGADSGARRAAPGGLEQPAGHELRGVWAEGEAVTVAMRGEEGSWWEFSPNVDDEYELGFTPTHWRPRPEGPK